MYATMCDEKSLDDLLEKIKADEYLSNDRRRLLIDTNIFQDKDLDMAFMPSIEEIVKVAKRKNIHFLVVYFAIMRLKLTHRFKCNHCAKIFVKEEQLRIHERKHRTDIMPSTSKKCVPKLKLFIFPYSLLLLLGALKGTTSPIKIRKRRAINFTMEDLENDDSDDDFVPIPKVKKEKKSKNVDLIGE